jgi:hypothetical protein
MAHRRDREDFTLSEVTERLHYDPLSGLFSWKIETMAFGGFKNPGSAAGQKSEAGYVLVGLWGRLYRAHRLAWLLMTGAWPVAEIDHINGDRSDNRWSNLREATSSQQKMNASIRSDNKSGCKGVSFRPDIGKWHSRIVLDGKTKLLGNFSLLSDAIVARKNAEKANHGDFVRLT